MHACMHACIYAHVQGWVGVARGFDLTIASSKLCTYVHRNLPYACACSDACCASVLVRVHVGVRMHVHVHVLDLSSLQWGEW